MYCRMIPLLNAFADPAPACHFHTWSFDEAGDLTSRSGVRLVQSRVANSKGRIPEHLDPMHIDENVVMLATSAVSIAGYPTTEAVHS